MRVCGAKNVSMVQPPAGQLPTGSPSEEVSIEAAVDATDAGTDARGKNQTLQIPKAFVINGRSASPSVSSVTHEIPVSANSVTHTPPPALAKPAPYEVGAGFVTMQP